MVMCSGGRDAVCMRKIRGRVVLEVWEFCVAGSVHSEGSWVDYSSHMLL